MKTIHMEIKKVIYLVSLLSLPFTENLSWGGQFLISAGGGYDQLQMTNSNGTGDGFYTGVGYVFGARFRMKLPLEVKGSGSNLDFWGSYQSYNSVNTADSSETNVLTPILVGTQLRILIFLVGIDYQFNTSVITAGASTYSKTYGTLGVSIGMEIPFSKRLGLQIMGFQHFGLAPGIAGNTGSRAVSEVTTNALLQFGLF